MQNKNTYQLATYYFPSYHADERRSERYGKGWDEWELVRAAKPRYPGHQQPKIPAWGYEDEADPSVFAKKIAAAADHGLGAFLFDWYWYEGKPFLHRALEEGYLRAPNAKRVPFALMWANHDWIELFPRRYRQEAELIFPGAVDRREFERVVHYVIEKYFSQPSYWTIDGCPYFSIYDMGTFMKGFGSVKAARAAIDFFREETRKAGFPNLHFNFIIWQIPVLPSEPAVADPAGRINDIGADSLTSYVWVHHAWPQTMPETPFETVFEGNRRVWAENMKYQQPYFPNVSMGWDATPRTEQGKPWEPTLGYPYSANISGNTPAAFEDALRASKEFLKQHPRSKNILTLNAWNEWTEGSYLEPDTIDGMAYLEAIKRVFPPAR